MRYVTETDPDEQEAPRAVALTEVDIPFMDLVRLMVMLAFAAIPATIIVAGVWFIVFAALAP